MGNKFGLCCFGGLEGDRTLDLRVANAALSQAVHKATRTPRQKFELFPEKADFIHNNGQEKMKPKTPRISQAIRGVLGRLLPL